MAWTLRRSLFLSRVDLDAWRTHFIRFLVERIDFGFNVRNASVSSGLLCYLLNLAWEVDSVHASCFVRVDDPLIEIVHALFEVVEGHEEVWLDGHEEMSNICWFVARIIWSCDVSSKCTT